MDPDWRYDQDIYCDRGGYPSDGGSKQCTLYIAVECEADCVYKVKLQMEGRENMTNKPVPTYITGDNYYTGSVAYNQTKYFYYPISKTTGDAVIFLNKTGPIGKNGDSWMLLNGQADASSYKLGVNATNFDSWLYPNKTNHRINSMTGVAT